MRCNHVELAYEWYQKFSQRIITQQIQKYFFLGEERLCSRALRTVDDQRASELVRLIVLVHSLNVVKALFELGIV